MDVMEYADPIKVELRLFESLFDSYMFEVSQSMAIRDHFRAEIVMKRFRNNVVSFIKEISRKLDQFESGIKHIDVIQKVNEHEDYISNLKDQIQIIKQCSDELDHENNFLKRELNQLKEKLKNIECCIFEKDDIINQLQGEIEKLRLSNETQCQYISNHDKDTDQEVQLLKNVIGLKEKETKLVKKERVDIEKKLRKLKEDNLELTRSVKQYREEVLECKQQIERCRNLANVDQQNLINTKSLLHDANDHLKDQEDQLNIDFDLITKLKNELECLHEQIKNFNDRNSVLLLELDDERKANSIIYKDMELLQVKLTELSNTVTQLTEKNEKLKRKKVDLTTELETVRQNVSEIQTKHTEIQIRLTNTEAELSTLKSKFDNISKQNTNQRKEIKFLNTAKSISDDKIRLLTNFVEDMRITEHDLQNRLISENHSIRTRMDIMKHAYEKLF